MAASTIRRSEHVSVSNLWFIPLGAALVHICIGSATRYIDFTPALVLLGLSASFGGPWAERRGPLVFRNPGSDLLRSRSPHRRPVLAFILRPGFVHRSVIAKRDQSSLTGTIQVRQSNGFGSRGLIQQVFSDGTMSHCDMPGVTFYRPIDALLPNSPAWLRIPQGLEFVVTTLRLRPDASICRMSSALGYP